jgi:hypothetical protein
VRGVLAAAALAGCAALVAATFLPVLRVAVDGRVAASLDRTGWDLHGPALLLIAALGAALLPAALRGSLAAALGVGVAGLAALGIAVIGDLPDVGATGLVGEGLREGRGEAGVGAYLEVLGGVLLLVAGGVLALLGRDED